ncbi:MAG: radical SAM protein [Planctomycetota bacterium]|nr:radical SAM protein [Planctomycetota bacterium]MDA1221099.1 radical SAM protein [Planctomycetota bacterium]
MKRWVELPRVVLRSRRRLRTLPRFLTYTVTFGCNARCSMCDSWQKPSPGDLELGEIDSIFRQLPTLDAVRLTGGEPFVRKDMVEIARAARAHLRPLQLHVTTNGFLTERIVRFAEERPRDVPLYLLVSIDDTGEGHDQIRGRRGAFSDAMRTIQALTPRQRELGLRIAVNQTLLGPGALDAYRRLRSVLAPLGLAHQAVLAYEASATYSVEDDVDVAPRDAAAYPTLGVFEDAEIRALLDELDADAASLPPSARLAKRYYLRGLRRRLLERQASPNPPCVALSAHLRIFPNGDVPTCQFNSRVVGNLRRQTFAEVWEGDLAHRQRSWVNDCVGCWAECEVVPSAIYTGDVARSLGPARRSSRSAAL